MQVRFLLGIPSRKRTCKKVRTAVKRQTEVCRSAYADFTRWRSIPAGDTKQEENLQKGSNRSKKADGSMPVCICRFYKVAKHSCWGYQAGREPAKKVRTAVKRQTEVCRFYNKKTSFEL